MLYTLCIVLILIASVLVVLAILVQSPKSGMAANFGASNQVMGVRQTADFLEKFTWGMAIAILVLSLIATLAVDSTHLSNSQSAAAKDATAIMEDLAPQTQMVPQAVEAQSEETPAQAQTPAPADVPAEK
ncbi:MAG: preprotein translocase subunit SecG [Alistipes sp.]|nr:preprotein translocase subunit SecG [Candidatus Alistipes equi]